MKRIEAFLKALVMVPLLLALLMGVGALMGAALAGCVALFLLVMAIGAVVTVLLPVYALICPEEIP